MRAGLSVDDSDRVGASPNLEPATNRFIVVHCISYCELRGERLFRVRAFYDLYGAATQLGILPGRGTLGEKALLVLRGFGLRAARGA